MPSGRAPPPGPGLPAGARGTRRTPAVRLGGERRDHAPFARPLEAEPLVEPFLRRARLDTEAQPLDALAARLLEQCLHQLLAEPAPAARRHDRDRHLRRRLVDAA